MKRNLKKVFRAAYAQAKPVLERTDEDWKALTALYRTMLADMMEKKLG